MNNENLNEEQRFFTASTIVEKEAVVNSGVNDIEEHSENFYG